MLDEAALGVKLPKHVHIRGAERARLGVRLGREYVEGGASIRDLAQATGRSFSFVRGLLREHGVPLRTTGGRWRW